VSKQVIAIICGGPSSEHEVSCVSAGGVLKGLDTNRFDPVLIGITKSGTWVLLPTDYQLEIINKKMPVIEDNGRHIELSTSGFEIDGQLLDVDCVFPVLHGEFGEDGKIQHLLDEAELAYVGSGVSASAQAMDKAVAKMLFASSGMKVADGVDVNSQDWRNKTEALSYPVFVKPSSGGSSRGTHKVKSVSELESEWFKTVYVKYAKIPQRRAAQPWEQAKHVAWLSSSENTYCTGQVLLVDGGMSARF